MLQAIDRIRADFQSRGFYQIRVDKQEERSADRVHLLLTVIPGAQFVLEDVTFSGNREVPSGKLGELMTTSSRSLLRPGSGRLVDEVLKGDLANIRSYYALQGYARARVGPRRSRCAAPVCRSPFRSSRDLPRWCRARPSMASTKSTRRGC